MDHGSSILKVVSEYRNYRLTTNALGNRVTIDFNRRASRWAYGESDVEIGFTEDGVISYLAIEFKTGLSNADLERLKRATRYEES